MTKHCALCQWHRDTSRDSRQQSHVVGADVKASKPIISAISIGKTASTGRTASAKAEYMNGNNFTVRVTARRTPTSLFSVIYTLQVSNYAVKSIYQPIIVRSEFN
jgi:hypothetical protein